MNLANDEETNGAKSDTLADSLARQVLERVRSDGLGEGDLFMTERGIEEHYSVSRNIAREAVSRLRGLGVLESRQGKGLIVGKPDPIGLLASTIGFFGNAHPEFVQLAQLRYVLETGVADLATRRASAEQIGQLRDLADEHARLAAAPERADDAEAALEFAFHSLILEMSGNPLISGLHGVLAKYFRSAAAVIDGWSDMTPHTVWQHRAIAEAFAQRDSEQVRVLTKQHLQSLLEWSLAAAAGDAAGPGAEATR